MHMVYYSMYIYYKFPSKKNVYIAKNIYHDVHVLLYSFNNALLSLKYMAIQLRILILTHVPNPTAKWPKPCGKFSTDGLWDMQNAIKGLIRFILVWVGGAYTCVMEQLWC